MALVVAESVSGRHHRDRHKAVRVTGDVDSLRPRLAVSSIVGSRTRDFTNLQWY